MQTLRLLSSWLMLACGFCGSLGCGSDDSEALFGVPPGGGGVGGDGGDAGSAAAGTAGTGGAAGTGGTAGFGNMAGSSGTGGFSGDPCAPSPAQSTNSGCEFWAVDLDQQDYGSDPASAPWGVLLANPGPTDADVTIEQNTAPVGDPPQPQSVFQAMIQPGESSVVTLPTREIDCGVVPNDYNSPGTCLSSRAFRISSSAPIVAHQFNALENAFSNDASLLIPTHALGHAHRIIGWPAGHPVALPPFNIVDRSYVTVVATRPNTVVRVRPTWRIRGNPPIQALQSGEELSLTIGPFDVLNLETDDATHQDDLTVASDLSGTAVEASEPVAVFSGVESTAAPGFLQVPTYPGWTSDSNCCLDHLEEQVFPARVLGTRYVIPRSPIRSTGGFREPDVIRFVGVAERATVNTDLPPPYESFSLDPGEVVTTWMQGDVVVEASAPVTVGQVLVSHGLVQGVDLGDPSMTILPPVEQFQTEYAISTPDAWDQNWVVIAAPQGGSVMLDGSPTDTCDVELSGMVQGVAYESRRCSVERGPHRLSGDRPFGVMLFGYVESASYALVGGTGLSPTYASPPLP